MLTSEDKRYVDSLRKIRSLGKILSAFGISDHALSPLLLKTLPPQGQTSPSGGGFPRLDTKYSNIRGDTLYAIKKIIPPDLAESLSRHDQITSRLAAIFSSKGSPKWNKKANRISGCQQAHLLFITSDSLNELETCIIPYACNSRCCPECSRVKSLKTFSRAYDTLLNIFVRRMPAVKFLTLTIVNPPVGSLAQGMADLLKAFRRLRRPKEMNGRRGDNFNCWTEHVDGYIWNLEITYNMKKKSWHPHIHVLFSGGYVHWKEWKDEWEKARRPTGRVGDIDIEDAYWRNSSGKKLSIRECDDPRDVLDVLKEICKYTMKPFESDIPASAIIELTEAVFNKRLFGSGGEWQLPPAQVRNVESQWHMEGGLAKVIDTDPFFWTDKVWQRQILAACSRSPSQWLRIVRNYDVYRQVQTADSLSDDPND